MIPKYPLIILMWMSPTWIHAAESSPPSATMSILKMILGLGVVLAVMAAIAWGTKRLFPYGTQQNATIKMIGATNVGARERVVVIEVADRWLVLGVANGQVNAIANLDAVVVEPDQASAATPSSSEPPNLPPFAKWLKQYMSQRKAD